MCNTLEGTIQSNHDLIGYLLSRDRSNHQSEGRKFARVFWHIFLPFKGAKNTYSFRIWLCRSVCRRGTCETSWGMRRRSSLWKQSYFLVIGTATQLVILPSHIPWIGQGVGILLLRYSVICVVPRQFLILIGWGENRSPNLFLYIIVTVNYFEGIFLCFKW